MMQVIYEDNHLLVINKPFGMPSQSDPSMDLDALTAAKAYIKEKYKKPGAVYLGLVHRLDRVASGIMVMARTSKAAGRLSEQIRKRTFDKKYAIITHGALETDKGVLIDLLYKDKQKNKSYVVSGNERKGTKEARLSYQQLARLEDKTLYEVQLDTGRSHQIRTQFSSRSCPIVGDAKYGSREKNKKAIALFAKEIAFDHPTQNKRCHFSLDLPDQYPFSLFKHAKISWE